MKEIHVRQIGGHALPHILDVTPVNKTQYELKGVFDEGIQEGDVLIPFHLENNFVVNQVIEKREPKGDWSGKSYEGTTPTYYKLLVSVAERPKPNQ
jgi:hypothetical protein